MTGRFARRPRGRQRGRERTARTPPGPGFPDRIAQYHAADYRGPAGLPTASCSWRAAPKPAARSPRSCPAGRQVVLATSAVGRVPTPHRGRDTVEWLYEAGFFHQRPADLPDPAMMRPHNRSSPRVRAPEPAGTGTRRRHSHRAAGRRGRPGVRFDDSARPTWPRRRLRRPCRRDGRRGDRAHRPTRPPAEPDHAAGTPVDLDTHDPGPGELGAVVWCTGFSGDFSWLDPALRRLRRATQAYGCAAAVPASGTSGCAGSPTGARPPWTASPPTLRPSRTPSGPTWTARIRAQGTRVGLAHIPRRRRQHYVTRTYRLGSR